MAKCSKCSKRKAKRHCPALGSELCSLCCGLLREKEIHCPENCPFLDKHKVYQEKRIFEKKEKPLTRDAFKEDDILRDERMAWLALHIEAPLRGISENNPTFSDKDAILALEYAKEKINKGKSTLIIPGEKTGPKNEVGELVYESLEKCKYEKTIILPGELETYKTEEKMKCLERIILIAKSWTKEDFEGRNYIEQLIIKFDKIKEFASQKKVLSSS